jgi:hypothetical protein
MRSKIVWTTGVARGLVLVVVMAWAACGDEPDAPEDTGQDGTGDGTNSAGTGGDSGDETGVSPGDTAGGSDGVGTSVPDTTTGGLNDDGTAADGITNDDATTTAGSQTETTDTGGADGGATDTGPFSTDTSDSSGTTGTTGPDDSGTTTEGETVETDAGVACTILFGRPVAKTGLTDAQCQPSCKCGGRSFTDVEYTEGDIAALRARRLETILPSVASNPYDTPELYPEPTSGVCAVLPGEKSATGYRLQSYADAAAARKAGGQVTHAGPCGLCSTLADLAVYIERLDLTEPVRQCGLKGFTGGEKAVYDCIKGLGFSDPCTQIWTWNTRHTQNACLSVCLAELNNPYQKPDGSLNPCLQCDEDKSGAVFKNVAGRTRRNTGIANALCRPCESVTPLVHRY